MYCVGAIRNAELAPAVFPGWLCRFYVAEGVPHEVVARLAAFDHVEVVRPPYDVGGMFWRFLPAFESGTVAIFRDVDSRISLRNRRCVVEWLASEKLMSIIRDHDQGHYSRVYPMLGGLWGFRGPMDEKLRDAMESRFSDAHFADQRFLKACVWPRYKDNCCEHGIHHTAWMAQSHSIDFCGQSYDEQERPIYSADSTKKIHYR